MISTVCSIGPGVGLATISTRPVPLKNRPTMVYHHTFQDAAGNVKTYSGVGQIDGKRAQISLKRVLKENPGFSHVGTKTKIMANRKQAYMLEDMLIQGSGGAGNKFRNFNKINSPGRKLLKWLIKAR